MGYQATQIRGGAEAFIAVADTSDEAAEQVPEEASGGRIGTTLQGSLPGQGVDNLHGTGPRVRHHNTELPL